MFKWDEKHFFLLPIGGVGVVFHIHKAALFLEHSLWPAFPCSLNETQRLPEYKAFYIDSLPRGGITLHKVPRYRPKCDKNNTLYIPLYTPIYRNVHWETFSKTPESMHGLKSTLLCSVREWGETKQIYISLNLSFNLIFPEAFTPSFVLPTLPHNAIHGSLSKQCIWHQNMRGQRVIRAGSSRNALS